MYRKDLVTIDKKHHIVIKLIPWSQDHQERNICDCTCNSDYLKMIFLLYIDLQWIFNMKGYPFNISVLKGAL